MNEHTAFLWLKIGYCGVIFIAVTFFHFTIEFLEIRKLKILVFWSYVAGFLWVISIWKSSYFIKGVYKYFWGYYPIAGLLHPIFLVFFVGLVSFSLTLLLYFLLVRKEKLPTFKRAQIKYTLSAFLIFDFASVDFLPNYGIQIYPFGYLPTLLFASIVAYTILRFHLLDIYLYIKRTAAYSLAVGLLTGVFVVIVLTITRYVTHLTRASSFSITVITAMLIALLFNPLRNRIQLIIDRLFYKKTYDFYSVVQKVSEGLKRRFNLEAIYDFIGNILFNTLGLRNFYILSASVSGYYRIVYRKPSGEETYGGNGVNTRPDIRRVRIEKDSSIVRFLNKHRRVVLYELLNEEDIEEREVEEIRKELRPFDVEVIVPVFVDDELSHMILLGRKTSGDVFNLEDIHLLNTLSHQLSVAIKQAWLYSEMLLSEKLASIGMMSATFAHEIRNPLTSLRTFTQLMPERYYDPDFRETFTKVVSFDIERIEGLIRDLLDFSSPTKPRGRDRFDLIGLVDETIDYITKKFNLQKKHIKVEKHYGDVEVKITGDEHRLKHAFVNIMSNGCQAMREGGTLRVGIDSDGKRVNISISDTGEGIDPGDIERIFEPFYTTREKGVGLGLAISKKAIEEHGGSIKVESCLGEGTTFTIVLPLSGK